MATELHRLLCFGSYDEVKSFVQKNPLSAWERCPESGKLPHHWIVSPMEDWFYPDFLDLPPNHWILQRKEKLSSLIETYPEGLTIQDDQGRIPLHVAAGATCQRNDETDESVQLLAFLMSAYGAGSQTRDSNGLIPLELAIAEQKFEHAQFLLENHWGKIHAAHKANDRPILHRALESMAPTIFLQLLIRKVDRCAQVEDSQGDLPLHVCLNNEYPFNTVKLVMKAYPDALKRRGSERRLPLCLELMKEARLDVVRLFADNYPNASFMSDCECMLPIHHAVSNKKVTIGVLEILKKHYPSALTYVFSNGDTLCHHALKKFLGSEDAIWWLLNICPMSIRAMNDHLECPLHCAARSRLVHFDCGLPLIRRLVETFPLAACLPNDKGILPLHYAIARHAPQEVIDCILEAFPGAVHHATIAGDLPLHVACFKSSSTETIEFLIQKNPIALNVHDGEGLLPFHRVCLSRRFKPEDISNIDLLIKKTGCSTLPLTKAGVHPLFLACQCNKELDVIWKLVQHSPDLFQNKNAEEVFTESPLKKRRISN